MLIINLKTLLNVIVASTASAIGTALINIHYNFSKTEYLIVFILWTNFVLICFILETTKKG